MVRFYCGDPDCSDVPGALSFEGEKSSPPSSGCRSYSRGVMDAFHTLAADRLIQATASNNNLIPFTWAVVSVVQCHHYYHGCWGGPSLESQREVFFIVGLSHSSEYFIWCCGGTLLSVFVRLAGSFPRRNFPSLFVTRPWDIAPLGSLCHRRSHLPTHPVQTPEEHFFIGSVG